MTVPSTFEQVALGCCRSTFIPVTDTNEEHHNAHSSGEPWKVDCP